ncbi:MULTISPECIES: circadian clock KaiB family protein [unclassified Afipia]|uniref:circadian clock KaiB family protein n=2 Tax=Afipia TaxID=1033 RepID=UPI0031BA93E0
MRGERFLMAGHPGDGPTPRVLRLFIADGTPGGRRALISRNRLAAALDEHKCRIEVVDVLTSPEAAESAGVLATPTLSDDSATPPRRIIGDFSNVDQIIAFFGCPRKEKHR